MSSTAIRSGYGVYKHLTNINLNEFPHETGSFFFAFHFCVRSSTCEFQRMTKVKLNKNWTQDIHIHIQKKKRRTRAIESENGLEATQCQTIHSAWKFNKWRKKESLNKPPSRMMDEWLAREKERNMSKKYRKHFHQKTHVHFFFC